MNDKIKQILEDSIIKLKSSKSSKIKTIIKKLKKAKSRI